MPSGFSRPPRKRDDDDNNNAYAYRNRIVHPVVDRNKSTPRISMFILLLYIVCFDSESSSFVVLFSRSVLLQYLYSVYNKGIGDIHYTCIVDTGREKW